LAKSDALTLLDVMQAVREAAANEQETLATVVHLMTSGQVRLSADAITAIRELSVTTHVAASGRRGSVPMPSSSRAMTWGEGAAALLTFGMLVFLWRM
jgi:hypothetical protein